MENFSISIPYTETALKEAAKMMLAIASALNKPAGPELLGILVRGDGSQLEVFPDTPLTLAQKLGMPTDAQLKWKGEIVTEAELEAAETTALDAFSDDDGDLEAGKTEIKTLDDAEIENIDDQTQNLNTVVTLELDADGLPWDARIHSESKKQKVNDKKWKQIRGLEKKKPGYIAEVEAELRASLLANPPAAANTEAPAPSPETTAAKTEETAPPPPKTEGDAPPPEVVTGEKPVIANFPEFLKATQLHKVDPEEVARACTKHGLTSVVVLGSRTDLLQTIVTEINWGL